MQVLAVNGSPMMDKGNTALLLTPFLEGMKEAGAEIEVIYTNKLKVNSCRGDFNCWFKNPGNCIQKDDMRTILPKFACADVWVLSTPLFVDGMSGPMKNLLDRLIPLLEPSIELRNGHCRHPLREGVREGKVVLISSCGFPEPDNFDALVSHVKAACRNLDREFTGALLRPSGPMVKILVDMGMPPTEIFDAARESGRQLIKRGEIDEALLKTIQQVIVPRETFIEQANQHIEQALAELKK